MHLEWHLEAANNPDTWETAADDLLNASGVLTREREAVLKREPEHTDVKSALAATMLRPVELMLRGMALECLMKAVWLKRGGRFVEGDGFRDFAGGRKHDLIEMANALRLKLLPREEDVLDRLTAFVRFAGRYPVPIRASESSLRPIRDSGGMAAPTVWPSHDDANFGDILANVKRELIAPAHKQ